MIEQGNERGGVRGVAKASSCSASLCVCLYLCMYHMYCGRTVKSLWWMQSWGWVEVVSGRWGGGTALWVEIYSKRRWERKTPRSIRIRRCLSDCFIKHMYFNCNNCTGIFTFFSCSFLILQISYSIFNRCAVATTLVCCEWSVGVPWELGGLIYFKNIIY